MKKRSGRGSGDDDRGRGGRRRGNVAPHEWAMGVEEEV